MITAVIIAKNEAQTIVGAIKSLKALTKDIIVVDDYSSDNTTLLAKKSGAKVFKPPVDSDFSQKRNSPLATIKTPWIFYLDADERITQKLAREIIKTVNSKNTASAYWVNRRNFILGAELRSQAWYPDPQPRLFKMSKFKGWAGHIHESADFIGQKSNLNSDILHFTHRDISSMINKANSWSDIEAKNLYSINHPPITTLRLIKLFVTQFFSKYFLDKNYQSGIRGIIESFLQTNSIMITYFKLWELQQNPPIKEIYQDLEKEVTK